MDHSKVDAALASALEDVDDPDAAVLAVFVHVAPGASPPPDQDWAAAGPATATLSARQVDELSEREWVGHLRLSRRLRPAAPASPLPGSPLPPVLAVVGLPGSGKSTLVEMLRELDGREVVYFGGVVVAEVARQGLPPGEASERTVREQLRAEGGMDAVARLALPEIEGHLAADEGVLLDGLYSMAEYLFLREHLAGQLAVVAVHASRRVRYERLRHRAHRPLEPEAAEERDLAEVRNLDKGGPIALADWHVVNDGSAEQLRSFAEDLVAGRLGPPPDPPRR